MGDDHTLAIPGTAEETSIWQKSSAADRQYHSAERKHPDLEKIRKHMAGSNYPYAKKRAGDVTAITCLPETSGSYDGMVGGSPALKHILSLMERVAPTNSTVLILGETGTGKELISNAIHHHSPRKGNPMITVNCAALAPTLIESELFGHERGSFTGATDRRIGKFEQAHNSTLFLDEIGEMPLELQVKLLRALQEREIERVGGNCSIKVDVRIIAATNRNLEEEVAAGRFRQDLYYRLNIFPISLPALRERRHDIPLLASSFIRRFACKTGKQIDSICNRALHQLINYHWPGNIRELEHQIERSVVLCTGNTLEKIYLPNTNPVIPEPALTIATEHMKTLDENERDHICAILKQCHGRIGGYLGAAELLGVPASTLFSKIKKLGIEKDS